MANVSCPFPTNLNPLSPNGFNLIIDKLNFATFFGQAAQLPSVSLGVSGQSTPFSRIPVPGERLS